MAAEEWAMNVRQLIRLLQQCDPTARVTFDAEGTSEEVTSLERLRHGAVELRSDTDEYAEELREIGRDVLSPE
jgi:hypothetical protein